MSTAPPPSRLVGLLALLALVVALGGCGQQPAETRAAATSPPSTSVAPTTTAAPTTTDEPAAGAAPTTTAAPTTLAPATTRAKATTTTKRRPITTKPPKKRNCDPSYPDVCLHDGIGDYDCAGGSGNGPNYVKGPLRVKPPDPFGLDANHDGTGCES